MIESEATKVAPGRYAVGTPSPLVVVETGVLHDAIERLAGLRHARPGAQPVPLKAEEVDALEALDNHPALATLADETLEELWIAAHASDALESERARDFWAALSSEERSGRSKSTPSTSSGDLDAQPPQTCPVCGQGALRVDGIDPFGFGFGYGLCLACSYRRSEEVAYDEAITSAIERHRNE